MAKGKRKKQVRTAPFTKAYATWPRLLHEAGASGVEWAVLVALAQHPQRNGYLSRPVADYGVAQEGLATATGCSASQVRKALEALTRKTFTGPDGKPTPILTRKASGHRGRCAVYKCNIPQWPNRDGEEPSGSDHKHNHENAQSGKDESVTNPTPNNKGMCTELDASCVPNSTPHLEIGGDGKDHPSPPWFR